MTKSVRIENADTSTNYKINVEVQEFVTAGSSVRRGGPGVYEVDQWITVETKILSMPTQLETLLLYKGRRFVITELENG